MLKHTNSEFSQNPYTLNFHDKHLEAVFQATHAKNVLPQMRKAIAMAAILYAMFSILDFIAIAENPISALFVRFGFAIPLFGFGYIATYKHYFKKRLQLLISVMLCIAGIGISTIAVIYEDGRGDIFFAGTLLPIFWSFVYSGLRFVNAVKVSICLIVIYQFLFLSFSQIPLNSFVGLNFFIFTSFIIGVLGGHTIERYYRRDFVNQRLIRIEKQKNEKLLLNILPKSIAAELKEHEGTIARDYDEITVLFADLVGFTKLSSSQSAKEIVTILNEIFSMFDKLTDKFGLEKIKTIGDAYMVTNNLNVDKAHAIHDVANFALAIREGMVSYNERTGQNIKLRIGVHNGPAVAGVIGVKKFIYDVWGSTVNIASRMESHSPVNGIHVSQAAYDSLQKYFVLEPRGEIKIKDLGVMSTYLLIAKRPS